MMTNLVLFTNSFLSYLLLVAVFVLVIGVAIFLGIMLRKRADHKAALAAENTDTGATNEI